MIAAVCAACVLCVLACVAVFFFRFAMARNFGGRQPENAWQTPPRAASAGADETSRRMYEAETWLYAEMQRRGVRHETRSADGLRLAARYLPPEGETRAIFLIVHGYRSSALHDFACAVRDLVPRGFGCFLIDQRAHGESEGKWICFGVKERFDVRDWAAYIGECYPGVPVILDGVSMGAASVMGAASLPLPACVSGIVADCGYTTMRAIFRKVIRQWFRLPPFPFVPLAEAVCRLVCGFGFSDVSSGECLSHARVPVLLAHGTADGFVPFSMAREIFSEAQGTADVEFFRAEGADHGMSYLADPAGYTAALERLFARCLKEGSL